MSVCCTCLLRHKYQTPATTKSKKARDRNKYPLLLPSSSLSSRNIRCQISEWYFNIVHMYAHKIRRHRQTYERKQRSIMTLIFNPYFALFNLSTAIDNIPRIRFTFSQQVTSSTPSESHRRCDSQESQSTS